MMTSTTPANGVEGQLIYTAMGTYMFRVYDGLGGFQDFDIMHCDLSVTINDPDASFYPESMVLDHSPETLGLPPA
jgi:hypothetical protein